MDPVLAERLRTTNAHCPACGYSLHALTRDTCPECAARIHLEDLDRDRPPLDSSSPIMLAFWLGLMVSMVTSLAVMIASVLTPVMTPSIVAMIVTAPIAFVVYGPGIAAVRLLAVTRAHQRSIDRLFVALAWAPMVAYPLLYFLCSLL